MNEELRVPDELLARCVGRLDLVQRVLNAYAKQMNEDIPKLVSELEAGNASGVASLAHRIKGASANASMNSLRSRAEEVENLAREDRQLEDIQASVAKLRSDWIALEQSTASLQVSTNP